MGRIAGLVSVLLIGTVLAKDQGPLAFQEYANDLVREVEISERLALDVCLGSSKAGEKVDQAYADCFGKTYTLENFASDSDGEDTDNDGISDVFQKKEVCFYEKMGWIANDQVDIEAVKKDMEGLESGLKEVYEGKVSECAAYSGDDSRNRMKRDISAQGFVSLIRAIRDADPAKGDNKNAGKNKKGKKSAKKGKGKKKSAKKGKGKKKSGKKGKGKSAKKGKGKKKSGKKGKGKKKSAKKGKGKKKSGKKGKGKKKSGKKGKGKKKSGKKEKKTAKSGGVSKTLYEQLWCVDLSFEQTLQKCVEDKFPKLP